MIKPVPPASNALRAFLIAVCCLTAPCTSVLAQNTHESRDYPPELLQEAQSLLPRFVDIPPIETTQLGEGLYSFRWGAYRNIFLVTNEGVIVTDPMGVSSSQVLRAEIAKITDQPVRFLVYSQSHWDHATGGELFKKEGAQIIAHEKCADHIQNRPNPGLIAPDITFADSYTVELGGRSLDLFYFGPSDNDCAIVMVPSTEPILYITDTLNPSPEVSVPWNPQTPALDMHSIIPFMKSLEELRQARNLTGYVGGHLSFESKAGKLVPYAIKGPFSQITENRVLYEQLFAAVEDEWIRGTPAESIPGVLDLVELSELANTSVDEVKIFIRRIAAYFETAGPAPRAVQEDVQIERLADGLYAYTAGDLRSLFMIGDEGVIVVDPISSHVAKNLRQHIAALTDNPVTHVVYSHSLNTRALGGQFYKSAGARFIAHESCAENFARNPRDGIVAPDEVFSTRHSVSLGDRSLDLYFLGEHFDCSVVMIARPENYMFVVGTVDPPVARVPADESMLNVHAYNLVAFLTSLEQLAGEQQVNAMIASVARAGEPATGSIRVISEQREFWERLFRDARDLKDRGVPSSRAGSVMNRTAYQDLQGFDPEKWPWIVRRVTSVLSTGE